MKIRSVHWMKNFIIIVVIAIVSRPALFCPGQEGERPREIPSVLTASAVEIGEIQSRKFPGNVIAIEEVNIVPRVTGYIEKINFKEGDFVNEGDLLFNIEEREYVANLKKAKANVTSCQSQILQDEAAIKEQEARIIELDALIKYKEATYNRNVELFHRGKAVSEDDVDNTKSALDAAQAQRDAAVAILAAAKARREAAQSALSAAEAIADLAAFDMDHTKITAPISGRIGKVTVTKGNLVTPQFGTLVDIRSISPIYIRFALSERLFRSVYGGEKQIKEKARIRLELADGTIHSEEGTIALIDNKIDSATNTIMIWATIPNVERQVIPGSYVSVLLSPKSDQNSCGVLLSAVQNDQSGSFVYVLDQENKAIRRPVKLGMITEKYYEILSGIKPSDVVIVDGMNKVQNGQPVIPVPYKDEN